MSASTLGLCDYRTGDADTTLTIFQRAVREVVLRNHLPGRLTGRYSRYRRSPIVSDELSIQ
ncbi:hypothetical protein B9G99_11195 [Kushneria konosiri]|uniref:Uncharacterized protein n=1 Tax=Kushneria konosiri TaxID=698828 RepID=A0A2Z2H7F6_9GAMM|nr:hypothetical protein B9G99_11195 [Kushneria konosiri]